MKTIEIEKRYNELANDDCCLSCGGAINYTDPLPGEHCADLGSGRGTDVFRLAELVGQDGFVYGLDISNKMLDKARKNANKMGIDNAEFRRTDLEKLDLPDESIDLIISNCTLNHAQNKQMVWNEIYRVLKNGGRFVISDIYSTSEVPEKYRNDPVAVSECWAGADTREVYFETLANAGFSEVKVLEESKPYPKGEIEVCSFTIASVKPKKSCCCCS